MVRVWFGDESQGLRRDRQEYVLMLERPCRDIEAAKRFYCEGLGFFVSGVTSNAYGRKVYVVHKNLPSFALGLQEAASTPADPPPTELLDIGIWNEDDWEATRSRMAELDISYTAEKLTNPHQKWIDYADPDGYMIRLTYTRPPVTTKRLDPNNRQFD